MTNTRGPYEELRAAVERLGGPMTHVREGSPWGTWVIALDRRSATFHSNGQGYPDLDRLYKPSIPNPQHYSDYTTELVPGAIDQLLNMLHNS